MTGTPTLSLTATTILSPTGVSNLLASPLAEIRPIWACFYCDETHVGYWDSCLNPYDPDDQEAYIAHLQRYVSDLEAWGLVRQRFVEAYPPDGQPVIISVFRVIPSGWPECVGVTPGTRLIPWLEMWPVTGDIEPPYSSGGLSPLSPLGWMSGQYILPRNLTATDYTLAYQQVWADRRGSWWRFYSRLTGAMLPLYAEELWHPTHHYIDSTGSMTQEDLEPGFSVYNSIHNLDPYIWHSPSSDDRWLQWVINFVEDQIP